MRSAISLSCFWFQVTFFGQLALDAQRAVTDVGGTEVAAGFTQGGAGLLAVALIERRLELGTGLLEPLDGCIEVFVDLAFLISRQCGQLADGHLGDVCGEDGQIAHGPPPH